MSTLDDFSALRASPLTSNLNDEQVRAIAAISVCRALDDDEILFEEGKTDNSLYVITSGRFAVVRELGGGERLTLHLLQAGDFAGEMGFIDGRPHSAGLRAVGRSTVCSFDREQFEALLLQDPMLVYRVMQNIVQVVHDILRRMNAQHVEMSNYISKQHGRY